MVFRAFVDLIFAAMGGSSDATLPQRRLHQEGLSTGASSSKIDQQLIDLVDNISDRTADKSDLAQTTDVSREVIESLLNEGHKLREEIATARAQRDKHREQRDKYREQRDRCREQYDSDQEKEKLQEQCHDLKKKNQQLERHYEHTSSRYNYVVERIVQPYSEAHGLQWIDQSQETIDVVIDPLAIDAVEVSKLRSQVRALQKELLTRVEKIEATSDEQFAREFRNLVALVKTLSRTVQPIEHPDLFEILGAPAMLKHVSQDHWNGRARKKCLIEAWTWSILILFVFKSPFTIFGEEGKSMAMLWSRVFGEDHVYGSPQPSALSETWRFTIMEHLFGNVVNPKMLTQESVKGRMNILESSMAEIREDAYNHLGSTFYQLSPNADLSSLRQIVDQACTLATQMCLQRARLQIVFPPVGDNFDKRKMVSMPDPNGEDVNDGVVAFVVNPGLAKWGDGHGKNLDHRYDIVPTLVQLEPTTLQKMEEHGESSAHGDDRGESFC